MFIVRQIRSLNRAKEILIKRNFNINFRQTFKPLNHIEDMMTKQLLWTTITVLTIYSSTQTAAVDLSLLGAKIQPKIVKIQAELDSLSIEELQTKLDENAAKAKRRSLSPEERLALHHRNCKISEQILDSRCSLNQEDIERLNTEFTHNIAQLNIHSIKPSERSDIALTNMVIIEKLTKIEIHEE
jgi:hypothetical protein